MITKEMKKEEAIKRMKALDIIDDAIEQFKNDDIVMVTEPPLGGLYWLTDEEKEMVRKFEEEHDVLVYMIVRAFTQLGKMDSLLYVSDWQEEWEYENEDLKDGYAMSYTINHDMPDCSEFGSIAVKPMFGGLIRIG